MSARRLEEILEECVSAHRQGRRTVEESLALYPSLAAQLEPLLRTAAAVSDSLDSYYPPSVAQQRGLAAFLYRARERRRIKALSGSFAQEGFLARFRPRMPMGFAAAAAAVAAVAIAVGATLMTGGGGDTDGPTVINPNDTPALETPALVQSLREQLDSIKARQSQGLVNPDEIADLSAATSQLAEISPEELDAAREEIGAILQEQLDLLNLIAETQPDVAAAAEEAGDTTRQVAGDIDLTLTTATATAVPGATDAATPTPTDGATPGPSAEPTEAPTPGPTTEPEPTPTSSPRENPGFPVPGQ